MENGRGREKKKHKHTNKKRIWVNNKPKKSAWRLETMFIPNDSFNNRVNFELRKGTCGFLGSTNALMHKPNVDKLKLIALASSNATPVTPLLPILSEPAKSTKNNFAVDLSFVAFFSRIIRAINTACDLDDSAFISVAVTARFSAPLSNNFFVSSQLPTACVDTP